MNEREDRNIAEHVAQVAASGGALPAGLRAAAAETESRSVARELLKIAQRLESGQSLMDAIHDRHGVSRFLARAIESGMPSDQFDDVLVELNDFHAEQRDMFRDLWICLTYPLILVAILVAVVTLCFGFIVPEIGHTIVDMWQIEGGSVLNAAMWMSKYGFWYVLWTVLGIAGGCVAIRLIVGAAKWRWLVGSMPLFGSLLNWNASWEFARRIELLLKRNVPLPDALRIVGGELRDANLADVCQRLSQGCQAGQSIHQQLGDTTRVLPTLTTFIQWGETNGTLTESLSLIRETMKDRIRARTAMMNCVIPPVTFLTVASLSIAVAGTILGPMVHMVRFLGTFGIAAMGSDSDLMLGASWVGFSILGLALWLTIHIMFYNRRYAPDAFLPFALKTTALILMFFGLVSLMAAASGPFSIPIVVALIIVSAMTANRFRTNETRSLLCQLGICMDHGLPIISAARAFAAERTDEIGVRANRLADRMEQGVPLADALKDSRLPMTLESRLAANQANTSLRTPDQVRSKINEAYASIDETTWLLQRMIYLCLVPVAGIAIWSFICFQIIPTYRQIFVDFDMELPPITIAAIATSNNLVATTTGRIVMSILGAFGLFFLVATLLAVLYFIGWISWEPPLIRRLTSSYHGALIMRAMADAIESGKEVLTALTEVGAAYPTRYIRRRVAYAADRIENGQDWIQAMTSERLIAKNTSAVLESASRTGNLPWALREMADTTHRRFLMRATAFSQLLTPIAIGLMAVPIGCMTVAIFLPLVQLIEALC